MEEAKLQVMVVVVAAAIILAVQAMGVVEAMAAKEIVMEDQEATMEGKVLLLHQWVEDTTINQLKVRCLTLHQMWEV